MNKIVLLLLLGMGIWESVTAQIDSVAVLLQRSKVEQDDSLRLVYADKIPGYLEKVGFGKYPLYPPVSFLGYRKCVNEEVELYSWAIPQQKGQMFYNWFRFKTDSKIYFFRSFSDGKSEDSAWLYYDLIGFRNHGKTYFALLGWNKMRNTNRKIVRICHFQDDGCLSFDHPLLRRGHSRSATLSFEYAVEGSMMLKQDKKGKRIIFDHLAPVDKKYEGYFMFYGPDASYDALVLKGGEWWYQENVKR